MALPTKLPLPKEETLKAIGESVVFWSDLDTELDFAICAAFGISTIVPKAQNSHAKPVAPYGKLITSELTFSQKENTLRRIVSVCLGKTKQAEFREVLDVVKSLNSDRNIMIHGRWYEFSDIFISTYRKRSRSEVIYTPNLDHLNDFIIRTKLTTERLHELALKYLGSLPYE